MGSNSSAEPEQPEPKQESCVPSCCPGGSGNEIVEPNSPRKISDLLEDGLNAQALADAGANALGNMQAAMGVVTDALGSDAETPKRSSWWGGGGDDDGGDQGGGFFGIWGSNGTEEPPAEDTLGKARQFAKKEFIEIQSFVQHSHITAKLACCAVAVALIVTSVFGMLGLFGAEFQAYQYVFGVWNIFWALVMILMDGKTEWFGKLGDYQKMLYGLAPSLSKTRGRSLVHFYVGTVNLSMFTIASNFFWVMLYLIQGGALVCCSVMMLVHGHTQNWQRRKQQQHQPNAQDVTEAVHSAQKALGILKEETLEVQHYIMHNHFTVKLFCFLLALGLATVSLLGMLNLFGAIFQPFFYVLGVYNFFFASLIAVVDGEPSFFEKCGGDLQTKVFEWFPFLASQKGRAFLHFYVGSINVVLLPGGFMDFAYIGIGSALILCSLLMLTHYNWCSGKLPNMEDLK